MPRAIRSLWITPGYPWPGDPVGFLFHQTQAQALTAFDVEVSVLAPTPWVPPLAAALRPHIAGVSRAPRNQRDGAIEIVRPRYLTSPRENHLGIAHLAQRIMCRPFVRPDILHAHFAYPSGAFGVALQRRERIPLMVTLHGDDVTIYPHHNARMRSLFKMTMRSADRVLAVSPALAEMTRDLSGVTPTVLSTGVDTRQFCATLNREKARAEFNLPRDAFVILYVGALLPQKGVHDLAAALQILDWPDAIGVFAGGGPSPPRGRNLQLLGRISSEKIPALLAAADAFVLPSWHEGLGQAAVEAGAAGIPVVAARTGGLADLVADDRGFGFPPRDVAALAQALQTIRAEPDEARRRAQRLKHHVQEQHDLARNAATLAALYRELVSPAAGLRP